MNIQMALLVYEPFGFFLIIFWDEYVARYGNDVTFFTLEYHEKKADITDPAFYVKIFIYYIDIVIKFDRVIEEEDDP